MCVYSAPSPAVLQVAAQVLGVPVGRVTIDDTATDKVPNSSPSAASVSTDLYGGAVRAACEELKARLKPFLEAEPAPTWEVRGCLCVYGYVCVCAHRWMCACRCACPVPVGVLAGAWVPAGACEAGFAKGLFMARGCICDMCAEVAACMMWRGSVCRRL